MRTAKPPLGWISGRMAGLFAWFAKLREAVMERLRPHLQELSATASALIRPVNEAIATFRQDEKVIDTLAALIATMLVPIIKFLTAVLKATKPVADRLATAIDRLRTAIA